MTPTVTLNQEQLLQRRDEILGKLGMTLEEFVEKSQKSALEGAEWQVKEELDSLTFLLGEDSDID